jgi:hypothetical protein
MVDAKCIFFILILVVVMITNSMGESVEFQEDEELARRELKDLLFARQSFKSCPYPFRLNQKGQCACSNSYSYDCQYSLRCPLLLEVVTYMK